MSRPYRVGMARPAQRVIEPTEIYSDLRAGQSTTMPENFGYTWTPVNGLEGAAEQVLKVGEKLIEKPAGGQPPALLPPAAAPAADPVAQAQQEIKKSTPNLMLLAVAGGAIGGLMSKKLGSTGTTVAVALALWSGWRLMNPNETK